ncbi:NAD-dependent epimerase/dehydratase family protein [Wenxinia saemankumensis]|uniref:Nucleoside-diphosphate-sugar epimerase n=1 Tax=Wenxinia saemankumensis TaxID=1447782 RepID=A0A1M6D023_9RHOB|nr:NAD-dependent epimerase/dehydratase family protein [Wenxinia saemankumensis]SHI66550.1 Nucleoside-diphosphate-sugar epimerase [Wenxinia saemankumensis]
MPHVAITGGGGFVCSALARAFAARGWQVSALDRAFDAPVEGVRQVTCDLLDAAGALASLRPDAVVHGAALTVAPEKAGLTRAAHLVVNTDLATRALSEARSGGAGAFLFLSSTGVFDRLDGLGAGRLTEDVVPTGRGPYAAAKRAGEEIVAAAAEPGFATLSVRLGNVFGPGEGTRPSRPHRSLPHRMAAEAAAGRPLTGVEGALRDWAWLPDLAAGIVRTVEALPGIGPGTIHAGEPPAMRDEDLAALVAPGAPVDLAPGPLRPPMGSARPSPMAQIAWTPVAEGLARLGLAAVTA